MNQYLIAPTEYKADVLSYLMNYENHVQGDLITSALGLFKTYDREIWVLYDIGYEPHNTAKWLTRYLKFNR